MEAPRRPRLSRYWAPQRQRLAAYRSRAARRSLPCTLTDAELAVLFHRPCFYCAARPTASSAVALNGVDRVNNALGYVHGNVVPCCARCNYMKGALSVQVFADQVARIQAHFVAGWRAGVIELPRLAAENPQELAEEPDDDDDTWHRNH